MIWIFFAVCVACLSPGASAECPLGWQHYENKCYHFSTTRLSWHSAASACRGHGAQLVAIESYAENEYLKYFASIQGEDFWIGGTDEVYEGHWLWTGSDEPLRFTDWDVGEPNGGRVENCLDFRMPRNFRRNDENCPNQQKYNCEKHY